MNLLGSASLLIGLMLIVGLVAQSQLGAVAQDGEQLYTADFQGSDWAGDFELALNEQRAIYAAIAGGTPSAAASRQLEERIAETRTTISEGMANLRREGALSKSELSELAAFEAAWKKQDELLLRGSTLAQTDPEAAIASPNGPQRRALDVALEHADVVGDSVESSAAQRYEEIQHVKSTSRELVLGLVILSALVGFGVAFLISRSIQRSVVDVLDRLRSLSEHCVAPARRHRRDLARRPHERGRPGHRAHRAHRR